MSVLWFSIKRFLLMSPLLLFGGSNVLYIPLVVGLTSVSFKRFGVWLHMLSKAYRMFSELGAFPHPLLIWNNKNQLRFLGGVFSLMLLRFGLQQWQGVSLQCHSSSTGSSHTLFCSSQIPNLYHSYYLWVPTGSQALVRTRCFTYILNLGIVLQ